MSQVMQAVEENSEEFRVYLNMIAKVCYTAVRAHYYVSGDDTMKSWKNCPSNVHVNAANRVLYFMKNPEAKFLPEDNSLEKEKISKIFKAVTKAFLP